ncbi:MAG: hypothetical protein ACK5H1_09475 [Tenacibaculum sp.]
MTSNKVISYSDDAGQFGFVITKANVLDTVTFNHILYEILKMPLYEFNKKIFLKSKFMSLEEVVVTAPPARSKKIVAKAMEKLNNIY